MTAGSPCSARSSRTTSRPRSPSGSRALVERHSLGRLARDDPQRHGGAGGGGLHRGQPHTSAGRVPTDKGYRLFVDRLSTVKPLSAPERRAIVSFLDGAIDLDDVMGRTVRLLAQLTRQVARRPVPVAVAVLGPPRRAGVPDAHPAAARAHRRHRPGRAAGGRPAGSGRPRRCCRRAAGAAQRPRARRPAGRRRRAGRGPGRGVRAGRPRHRRRGGGDPARDARRAARGARGAGRHRQPRRARSRLRRQRAPGARGARGAGGAAPAARRGVRGPRRVPPDGAHRPREPGRGPRHDLRRVPVGYGADRGPDGTARRSSARPGWTTPARWPRSAPSRATSAGSWQSSDLRPPSPDHSRRPIHSGREAALGNRLLRRPRRVANDATPDEIKRAYRQLARELHPDVNPDHATQDRFKEVTAAYEVLSDPEKRQMYDLGGDPRGGRRVRRAGFGFGDIMDAFFGAADAAGRARGCAAARTPSSGSTSTLSEAAFGVAREFSVDTAVVCPSCTGEGTAPGTHARRVRRCATAAARCSRCSAPSSARS